jgi:hypothetical protein
LLWRLGVIGVSLILIYTLYKKSGSIPLINIAVGGQFRIPLIWHEG